MFPDIVIFDKTFTMYSVMWLLGVFTAGYLVCKESTKNNVDDNETIVVLLVSSLGSLFGAHLLYGFTNYKTAIIIIDNISLIDNFKTFIQSVILIFGGAVFYGGLFGGIFAGVYYLKKKNKNVSLFSRIIVPYIPLFHFFGRLGCFLSGCCFGVESKVGLTYHYSPILEANSVQRFPIQLVEAAFNIVLFSVLRKLSKNHKLDNYLLYFYLIAYAIIRFILEFFRGDVLRGIYFGVSTSQIISVLILMIVPFFIRKTLKEEKKLFSLI